MAEMGCLERYLFQGWRETIKTNKMKNSDIKFVVDRIKAQEGETVMLSWECGVPDAVTLTIDNGFTKSQIQLPDSGSRSVAIQKSKGTTTLRLTVAASGRIVRREVVVRVKNLKTIKARPYRASSSPRGGSLKGLWGRVNGWFRGQLQRWSYAWRAMPPRRRRIYQAIFIWLMAMMVATCSHNSGYTAGYKEALRQVQSGSVQHPV